MFYNVYTDGACSDIIKTVGCAYCVFTNTEFIYSSCTKLPNMHNPTHAETISVGLALSYLLSNCNLKPEDTIQINVDCNAVIDFCTSYQDNNNSIRSNVSTVRSTIKIVREVSKKCTLKFRRVRGHKGFLNPNTYVDRLAKFAMWS